METERIRKIMSGLLYACGTLEHMVALLQQELDDSEGGKKRGNRADKKTVRRGIDVDEAVYMDDGRAE